MISQLFQAVNLFLDCICEFMAACLLLCAALAAGSGPLRPPAVHPSADDVVPIDFNTAIRVALRQYAALGEESPVLALWHEAFEPMGVDLDDTGS